MVFLVVGFLYLRRLLHQLILYHYGLHLVVHVLLVVGLTLCLLTHLLLCHGQLRALLLDALTVLAQLALQGLGLARCSGATLSCSLLFLLELL